MPQLLDFPTNHDKTELGSTRTAGSAIACHLKHLLTYLKNSVCQRRRLRRPAWSHAGLQERARSHATDLSVLRCDMTRPLYIQLYSPLLVQKNNSRCLNRIKSTCKIRKSLTRFREGFLILQVLIYGTYP